MIVDFGGSELKVGINVTEGDETFSRGQIASEASNRVHFGFSFPVLLALGE
jgi:hypothetical protein